MERTPTSGGANERSFSSARAMAAARHRRSDIFSSAKRSPFSSAG